MVVTQSKDKRGGSLLGRLLLGGIVLAGAVACMSVLAATVTFEEKPAGPVDEQELKKLQTLSADDLTALSDETVKSLSSQPLNNQAVHRLATLRSLLGKNAEAEELAIESATRSHRDTRSQLAAVMLFFSRKRYAEGLKHLDGVLRSKPAASAEIFKLLKNSQPDPQFRTKLADLLVTNPPWRWKYLQDLMATEKDGQLAFQLMTALSKAGGQVTSEELRYFIVTQIMHGHYDLAYFVWLDTLDHESLQKVSDIFDGKFELTPNNSYFDWTLDNYPNARIEVSPDSGNANEKRLRIEFFGAGQRFTHVRQYLMLQPGSYDFTADYFAKNFESPTGLQWAIYCVEGLAYLGKSPSTQKTASWDKLTFSFDVPNNNCGAQLLQLESSSGATLDQRYQGTISFDNLNLRDKTP